MFHVLVHLTNVKRTSLTFSFDSRRADVQIKQSDTVETDGQYNT